MTPLLVQRLRADRSFERLYRRHVGDVYRYTLAVLDNAADAEDVTQTTFLNAYRAIRRGERPRKPEHWLIKIAHNVCRQRFRQASRRVAEVALDENVGPLTIEEDAGPSADDIRRALGHLAFNQRAALVMRELEGRSYAEIAEVLAVSVSAVETLVFRARRSLREQLEGSLTCAEAEFAISRQLDGRLDRRGRGQLRAHLRECGECATLARRQRAQRAAVKAIGVVPLPPGLASLLGGGATVGAGAGAKAAALIAAGTIATGVTVEGARHAGLSPAANGDAAARAVSAPPPAAARLFERSAVVAADRAAAVAWPRRGARADAAGAARNLRVNAHDRAARARDRAPAAARAGRGRVSPPSAPRAGRTFARALPAAPASAHARPARSARPQRPAAPVVPRAVRRAPAPFVPRRQMSASLPERAVARAATGTPPVTKRVAAPVSAEDPVGAAAEEPATVVRRPPAKK